MSRRALVIGAGRIFGFAWSVGFDCRDADHLVG